MDKFLAALRFLTILPIPGSGGTQEGSLAKSTVFFPVVGLCIGTVMAVMGWWVWKFLPPLLAAACMVMGLLSVSGAFHLDGLADSADGFFSARPREQVLEIMRDSRIGVMGVIAVVMVLIFKTTALASMPRSQAVAALFLMPLAGRCVMVIKMTLLPYLRKDGGVGTVFYSEPHQKLKQVLWAALILYSGAWYSGGVQNITAAVISLVVVLLFAFYCKVKIGGATGDTIGASCELAETVVVVALAANYCN